MVNFDAYGVAITNLCTLVLRDMSDLKGEIQSCMSAFKSTKRNTNDALITLSGHITQTEQRLGAPIDTFQASIGSQLQDLLGYVIWVMPKRVKNRRG